MNILFLKHEIHYLMNKILGVRNLTRNQLEQWLATIEIDATKVLDVGVGFSPVRDRLKSCNASQYKTLDNNSENEIKPDFVLDLNLLDNKGVVKRVQKYSPGVIFCVEVMEYIYRPDAVLKFFHSSLAKNGLLYISFHTFYPWHKPYKNDYLRYTKAGIGKLLDSAGFSKWEITPRVAALGGRDLWLFFRKEGLIGFRDKINLDMGYLVKAYK
jgi:SAM-dependent methyltransferase